jgi:glycosyltransferase involved in cell wall biosynthesis
LLVVTAAFAPGRSVGGRRAERLVQRFVARGWQVTLLTLKPPYQLPLDPNLRVVGPFERIDTHALMPRMWARNVVEALKELRRGPASAQPGGATSDVAPTRPNPRRRWWRTLADRIVTPLEFPDEFAGWAPFAKAAVRGRRFDVVLSTAPPHSLSMLARDLARQCRSRLVLDYRDPWTDQVERVEPDHAVIRRHREREDACLAAADLVVGVSPTICRWLEARARCPVVFVQNGADVAPQAWHSDTLPLGSPLHLAYTGGLAYGRDLGPLIAGMARLAQSGRDSALVLDYAGPHGAAVRAQAVQHGVQAAVVDHGEVGRDRALELTDAALAGIAIVPPDPTWHYSLPGKLFDVVGRSRPLLLIAPHACDAAELVQRHGLGWTVDNEDAGAMDAALAAIVERRVPRPRDLQELHAEHLLDTLVDHVGALIGHRTHM